MVYNHKNMKFAFLVHPRDLNDVFKKYPLLKFLPSRIVNFTLKIKSPIIVSKINGLISQKTGVRANGFLISVGMTAKEMLSNRELAKKEIIKAVLCAKKHDVKIIGLGALTSPMVKGGVDLIDKFNVTITNGNTLTVGTAMVGIKKVLTMNKKINKNPVFAVVGATGSIGSAISKLVVMEGLVNDILLIGRTKEKLATLKSFLTKNSKNNINIRISVDINQLIEADVIVVATSADNALIRAEILKENAIVYDITQPKNTSKMISIERPDVIVVDGALVKLPKYVSHNFDYGLPPNLTFSCLAETMILAAEDEESNFSIGDVDPEKVSYIINLAKKYNIVTAPLNNLGEEI